MSKVDTAIQCAYETLSYIKRKGQISRHVNDMIDLSLSAMEQFYKNPPAVYDEERRSWWIEQMDIHFDGHLKKFSEEQIDQMVKYLLEEDCDNDDGIVSDILFHALDWNGLGGLVFGDECYDD